MPKPAARKIPEPIAAKPASPRQAKSPRVAATPTEAAAPAVAIHRYLAAYLTGLANRLSSGASAHYRRHWNIGMAEWRALMAIGTSSDRIAREIAAMADLDNAAASKSLRGLQQRGYVELEPTARRGGATLVRLTPSGLKLFRELERSARRRDQRLVGGFSADEAETLWALLRKLHDQIPVMNEEEATAPARPRRATKKLPDASGQG